MARKRAAGLEHLAREFRRRLDQRHDLQMVGRAMAGGVRRHVGEHHVGRTAEHRLEPVGRLGIEEIELREFDAGNGSMSRMSIATTRPRAPTRFAATWLQPPGAAPRSTTRAPDLRR